MHLLRHLTLLLSKPKCFCAMVAKLGSLKPDLAVPGSAASQPFTLFVKWGEYYNDCGLGWKVAQATGGSAGCPEDARCHELAFFTFFSPYFS